MFSLPICRCGRSQHILLCWLIVAALSLPLSANAGQAPDPDATQTNVLFGWQLRTAASTAGDLPFWLHSNRFGAIDPHSAQAGLNLSGSWHHSLDSGLTFSTRTNVLFRTASDTDLLLQEGYLQAGYGPFVLWAGRKREYFGLVHPELSMGTMDLSTNARPMPKITFATDGFQPVPGTRRVFYYDGGLSHGWMTDDDHRFMDHVWLHQKYLYLRFFTEDAPVVPRAGLKHFAQWGGQSDDFGISPRSLKAYRDVFFSLAGDSKEIFGGGELPNQFQNHFGTYDFALMFNLGRYKVSVSRQFILEDTPNARFGTPWDGMWGAWIELRPDKRTRWTANRPDDWRTDHRPLLKAVNYEHINTLDGLTRYEHRDAEQHVNYYNHWAYLGGWTYGGRVLGNPLFFGDPDYYGVVNNQLVGHHIGLKGFAGPVDWRFFSTYTRNYGAGRTYVLDDEIVRDTGLTSRNDQWSFMLELRTTALHPALETAATMALDVGDAHPDAFGLLLSLRWSAYGKR